MEIVHESTQIQRRVVALREKGERVGLVPTMGALHAGHLSLVEAARKSCDCVIATIFVNPTQFGPHEDLQKYPRTLDADLQALNDLGTDLVFTPTLEEIYPIGFSTYVEPPQVANRWEGACRPGHFRGVSTVVLKLFHLIPAHVSFFGQKDYQQSLVIRRMVADLGMNLEIRVCPIIRESDGLAMSSRNRFLSVVERRQAVSISRSLATIRQLFGAGETDAGRLRDSALAELSAAGISQIDYLAMVDGSTLEEVSRASPGTVVLIAVRVGSTRLIDNEILGLPPNTTG